MPPLTAATERASPPPGGRSQSAVPLSSASCLPFLRSGSGRLEVKSSAPSGRKCGLPSPSADLVSLAGGPPPVSIRQMLVTYFFLSALSDCTVAASQLPSGDSRSPVSLGMAM
jgi:hypothetical protein